MAKQKCPDCGKTFKRLALHARKCGKGAKAKVVPVKKRRGKKTTLRDLQEQITAIETRIEIAVKILMGV